MLTWIVMTISAMSLEELWAEARDHHPLQKAPREKGKVWTDVAALDSHNEFLEWLKKGKLKHISGFQVGDYYSHS